MVFLETSRQEMWQVMEVHGLENKRPNLGAEVGFKYFRNGYVVKVWTSCFRAEVAQCRREPLISQDVVVSKPVGTDFGWVVLTDAHNNAEYFARSTKRTKNFVKNLLQRAMITAQKVQNRPLCEQYSTFMKIRRKPSGATFWECTLIDRHANRRRTSKDWDCGLGPKGKKVVGKARSAYRRTHEKEKAEGRGQRRASEIRIGWNATKKPYPPAA